MIHVCKAVIGDDDHNCLGIILDRRIDELAYHTVHGFKGLIGLCAEGSGHVLGFIERTEVNCHKARLLALQCRTRRHL